MTTATTVDVQPEPIAAPAPAPRSIAPRQFRAPTATIALTLLLLALLAIPRVHGNMRLAWSIAGVSGALLLWQLVLWARARRRAHTFAVEYVPVKAHYVQATVQFCILLWWAWYEPDVRTAGPLIAAQLLFMYVLDALLTWSRGRTWRLGFGPFPIILSTNLLLWFKDDWFFLQFLMVALGALGKQFVQWRHEGRHRHIFNPSVFGQSIFAVGLIVTGLTNELTWGREIASSFETPHMLVVIFLLGLVVQYQFHVTLMTLSAAMTLIVVNLIYTQITGVYFFVNLNVAAPIFLGIHLLITDPSTSPRTNTGRVLFGALYGLGYIALFRIFDLYEVPLFWDKLLPVPILNLMVPLIDRLARSGIVGRINHRWETALQPRPLNLVHMGIWITVFATMFMTGFIAAPHEGNSIPFWKKAIAEGRHHARHSLVMAAGALAEGSGSAQAYNELGLICMEGDIVNQNSAKAARYFATACEMGDINGCANVAVQYLFQYERRSDEDVARALAALESACGEGTDLLSCYLVGQAYESGRGRQPDPTKAIEYYQRCGANLYACKGLARIALTQSAVPVDLSQVVLTLGQAVQKDPESAWYLAYMFETGTGVLRDPQKANLLLNHACRLGMRQACETLNQPAMLPYRNPPMMVPGWLTAYPLPQ